MYFSFFIEKTFLSWTLSLTLFTFGLSDNVELSNKPADTSDLETWKKDLHLNDELISKLYDAVNNFLIRKDLDKDSDYDIRSDDSFEISIPNDKSSGLSEDISKYNNNYSGESDHSKHKRSPCYGFQDSISCFRSYLSLWMLQRQGLKDPISLRNIGKRAYSFRNVGKRSKYYSFRNIGKRSSAFFRNIGKRDAFDSTLRDDEQVSLYKKDFRFPRSYFRNIGKRTDAFERDDRMAFRNIGKRLSFRNIGKREQPFERENRMSFRNIGKREPLFERDDRMSFRNIGKRDPIYERDSRMSFRNIGKREPLFERDDRMAFRNIGKRYSTFERDDRMAFRNIGKRDPTFERDDRMAFRNIGRRESDDLNDTPSLSSQRNDERTQTMIDSSFSDSDNMNSEAVKDMSDVL